MECRIVSYLIPDQLEVFYILISSTQVSWMWNLVGDLYLI